MIELEVGADGYEAHGTDMASSLKSGYFSHSILFLSVALYIMVGVHYTCHSQMRLIGVFLLSLGGRFVNFVWTRSWASVSDVLLYMYSAGVLPSLSNLKLRTLCLIFQRSSSFLLLVIHPDAFIYTVVRFDDVGNGRTNFSKVDTKQYYTL